MLFANFPAASTHLYTAKCTQEINFKTQTQNCEKLLSLYSYMYVYNIDIYMCVNVCMYIYTYKTYRKTVLIDFVWENVASVFVSFFASE
jgi:hypothetical protein